MLIGLEDDCEGKLGACILHGKDGKDGMRFVKFCWLFVLDSVERRIVEMQSLQC